MTCPACHRATITSAPADYIWEGRCAGCGHWETFAVAPTALHHPHRRAHRPTRPYPTTPTASAAYALDPHGQTGDTTGGSYEPPMPDHARSRPPRSVSRTPVRVSEGDLNDRLPRGVQRQGAAAAGVSQRSRRPLPRWLPLDSARCQRLALAIRLANRHTYHDSSMTLQVCIIYVCQGCRCTSPTNSTTP